ncbi:MAG: hypothetical protein IKG27_03485, partial [Bacilli bacterium]|nr:hypothetical protein [Bacilli bacterium]
TKNGYIDVKRKSAETKIADAIISPQASSGSNTTVNLTYPIGCTNGKYTCTYTKDSETAVTITETTTSVNFVGSGTIATEVKSNRKPTNKLTNSQNITIKFTASFLKGSNVDTIGKTSEACTVTSGNTTCEVTLPSITRKTGCTIIGWGSSNTATSGTAAGQKVALSKNTTYYANSRLNVLTMKLHMNGGSRDTSSDTAISNSGSYITRGGTTEFYKVKYNATTNPWNYNNPGGVNIKRNGYAAVSKKQWCTASDGTGTCIDQDKEYKAQEIYSSVADADKTITLYVNWVANVVDISSKVTTQAEASCKGYWRDYRYRFTIDYHGSSPSSGYMCYNRPSEGSKYCGNYKNNTNTTAGDACFTKDDTWDFYRSTGRVDIYVKAANGASKATYATK